MRKQCIYQALILRGLESRLSTAILSLSACCWSLLVLRYDSLKTAVIPAVHGKQYTSVPILYMNPTGFI